MFTKFALATVALSLTAMPVYAADMSSAIVRYNDLDLTNAQDLARLEIRIKSAVDAVCNVRERSVLRQRPSTAHCKAEASIKAHDAFDKLVNASK